MMNAVNKSYYFNGKIKADNKLNYYHEKFHKHIAEETNYNLFQECAFFIMIICVAFYSLQWKIAGIVLFFGSELLEEIICWNYAYRLMRLAHKRIKNK